MSDPKRKFNGTIKQTSVTERSRSGSFSVTFEAHEGNEKLGSMKLSHSGSRNTTTVGTIENNREKTVKGVGFALMQTAETVARKNKANTLEATSVAWEAHDFYKRQGFAPNAQQFQNAKQLGLSDQQAEKVTATWEKNLSHSSSSSSSDPTSKRLSCTIM